MFEKLKSWKTTITGIVLCIFSLILFSQDRPLEAGIVLTAGVGLLAAKDSTVTGVGSSAVTESEIKKDLSQKNQV